MGRSDDQKNATLTAVVDPPTYRFVDSLYVPNDPVTKIRENIRWLSVDDAIDYVSPGDRFLYEYIFENDIIRLPWDVDSYLPKDQEHRFEEHIADLDALAEKHIRIQLARWDSVLGPLDIARASRHGRDPESGLLKVSNRYFLIGGRIRDGDMKEVVAISNPPDACWDKKGSRCALFDIKIYDDKRLMSCILCPKQPKDRRVLKIESGHAPCEFLIQNVDPSWPLLELPKVVPKVKPLRFQQLRLSDHDQKNDDPVDFDRIREAVNGLHDCRADDRGTWMRVIFVIMRAAKSSGCLDRGVELAHAFSQRSPKYDAKAVDSLISGEDPSKVDSVGMGTLMTYLREDNPALADSLSRKHDPVTPEVIYAGLENAHKPIVDIVMPALSDNLVFACDTSSWYRYQTGRWKEIHEVVVSAVIRDTAMPLLKRAHSDLSRKMERLDIEAAVRGTSSSSKDTNDLRKCLLRTITMLHNQSKLRDIVRYARIAFRVEEFITRLDSDPYVLAFNNGLLNLRSFEFRALVPSDFVSKTTGYDYVAGEPNEVFLRFVSQIYPHDDVREFAQRNYGYALLGVHNEKIFTLLSDERNGFNGKSKMMQLLLQTFGDSEINGYGIKSAPELLYKHDGTRSINDHGGGFLPYRGARFSYIEELDPKKVLDNDRIKDLNGGDTSISARIPHSSVTATFKWGVTLFAAFNEGRCPQLDATDVSLIDRLITIPHVSRFTSEASELTAPHTYLSNPDINLNFPGWRNDCINWLLTGLKNYYQHRFASVPPSCLVLKNKIVAARDTVGAFIRDHVGARKSRC